MIRDNGLNYTTQIVRFDSHNELNVPIEIDDDHHWSMVVWYSIVPVYPDQSIPPVRPQCRATTKTEATGGGGGGVRPPWAWDDILPKRPTPPGIGVT